MPILGSLTPDDPVRCLWRTAKKVERCGTSIQDYACVLNCTLVSGCPYMAPCRWHMMECLAHPHPDWNECGPPA